MNLNAKILVTSNIAVDADMVAKLLKDEFSDVSVSRDPDRAVEDFERVCPDVLVLAFRSLEEAEQYYLGLHRHSSRVHSIAHRTVVLCRKEDLKRVYARCRKQYFDDYVLFWPANNDGPRLYMSVHLAVRLQQLSKGEQPGEQAFHKLAARIDILERLLAERLPEGDACLARVDASLSDAKAGATVALDQFSNRVAALELNVRSGAEISSELLRLRENLIDGSFERIDDSLRPVRQWAGELIPAINEHLSGMREERLSVVRPSRHVILVDDDAFQHRLMAHMLKDTGIRLSFVHDGSSALSALHNDPPELMFVDFHMPAMSGIDLVRVIRAEPRFAHTPIVMVTGSSAKQNVVESLQAGATDFLVKPFERSRLAGKLSKYLGVQFTL